MRLHYIPIPLFLLPAFLTTTSAIPFTTTNLNKPTVRIRSPSLNHHRNPPSPHAPPPPPPPPPPLKPRTPQQTTLSNNITPCANSCRREFLDFCRSLHVDSEAGYRKCMCVDKSGVQYMDACARYCNGENRSSGEGNQVDALRGWWEGWCESHPQIEIPTQSSRTTTATTSSTATSLPTVQPPTPEDDKNNTADEDDQPPKSNSSRPNVAIIAGSSVTFATAFVFITYLIFIRRRRDGRGGSRSPLLASIKSRFLGSPRPGGHSRGLSRYQLGGGRNNKRRSKPARSPNPGRRSRGTSGSGSGAFEQIDGQAVTPPATKEVGGFIARFTPGILRGGGGNQEGGGEYTYQQAPAGTWTTADKLYGAETEEVEESVAAYFRSKGIASERVPSGSTIMGSEMEAAAAAAAARIGVGGSASATGIRGERERLREVTYADVYGDDGIMPGDSVSVKGKRGSGMDSDGLGFIYERRGSTPAPQLIDHHHHYHQDEENFTGINATPEMRQRQWGTGHNHSGSSSSRNPLSPDSTQLGRFSFEEVDLVEPDADRYSTWENNFRNRRIHTASSEMHFMPTTTAAGGSHGVTMGISNGNGGYYGRVRTEDEDEDEDEGEDGGHQQGQGGDNQSRVVEVSGSNSYSHAKKPLSTWKIPAAVKSEIKKHSWRLRGSSKSERGEYGVI